MLAPVRRWLGRLASVGVAPDDTDDVRLFRLSQIVLIFILPFLLQWSPGGYVASVKGKGRIASWLVTAGDGLREAAVRSILSAETAHGRPNGDAR